MHKSIPIFLILLCQTPVERKLVSAQDHSFHVFQQDGVTIAETKGGPKYTEELFSYELVLTLQSDEREESLLTNPMQFLSDQNGSFYVADWSEKRIAVFNSEGIFSHSIGRQESGPGEISGWPTIMSIQNGIVGVYDFSLRRFTRFGTDGSLLDATRIPDDAQSIILDFYPVSDVTSLCINRIGGNDRVNEYVQIARYAQSGQLVWSQTFDEIKVSYSVYGEFEHLPNPIRMLYQYGAQPIALIHHKLGIAYSSCWKPLIQVFNLNGDHIRNIQADIKPEPVSRTERREIRSFLEERIRRSRGPMKNQFEAELENIEYPSSKAFWSDMEIDEAGFFWLQLPTHQFFHLSQRWTGLFYRIFSPEGEYLGITQRPKGFRTRASHGLLLVRELEQESGEVLLKVYRIRSNIQNFVYP